MLLSPWQKEVMLLVALVCLSVCLSVCLWTTLLKKLWTDLGKILWRGHGCYSKKLVDLYSFVFTKNNILFWNAAESVIFHLSSSPLLLLLCVEFTATIKDLCRLYLARIKLLNGHTHSSIELIKFCWWSRSSKVSKWAKKHHIGSSMIRLWCR